MSTRPDLGPFLRRLFEGDAQVARPQPGQTRFGSRGYKVAGKAFAMEANGALALKLPAEWVRELVAQKTGAALNMGGRTMKEWIVIDDPSMWHALALEARGFVGSVGKKGV